MTTEVTVTKDAAMSIPSCRTSMGSGKLFVMLYFQPVNKTDADFSVFFYAEHLTRTYLYNKDRTYVFFERLKDG